MESLIFPLFWDFKKRQVLFWKFSFWLKKENFSWFFFLHHINLTFRQKQFNSHWLLIGFHYPQCIATQFLVCSGMCSVTTVTIATAPCSDIICHRDVKVFVGTDHWWVGALPLVRLFPPRANQNPWSLTKGQRSGEKLKRKWLKCPQSVWHQRVRGRAIWLLASVLISY